VQLTILSTLFCSLVACTSGNLVEVESNPNIPEFPDIFSSKPEIVSLSDIHLLTPQQEQDFFDYFNDPALRNVEQHVRLANYLFSSTTNFRYESKTYTASEALALGQGNCMSLAVATSALAKLANIQIEYQLIDSTPVYQLSGSVANKGLHIRSLIYKTEKEGAVDAFSSNSKSLINRTKGLIIDYFPAEDGRFIGNVSYDEYIAVYYRNMAAEALSKNDYASSYWYTLESMKYDPLSSDALNMLAIIYKRSGDLDKAEEIYLYGIAQADDKLTLLKNYHVLLTTQGRTEAAQAVNNTLITMRDPSPIHWFNVARHSYDSNDYANAIRFYRRAIDIAPYLHEAHLGIALSFFQLGQYNNAEQSLNQAIDNVNDFTTRDLYESKLNALRNL
tara:strand:- start:40964 stop:42133 length:1170 start_codon:yes stop_codon:yes gene_type:complete